MNVKIQVKLHEIQIANYLRLSSISNKKMFANLSNYAIMNTSYKLDTKSFLSAIFQRANGNDVFGASFQQYNS